MVLMTPVDIERKGKMMTSSSFKGRDLENSDESDHDQQDNIVLVGETMNFKKKKPGKLELQKTVPALDIINGPDQQAQILSSRPASELHAAATKLQKFYKGYRTRRNLADCAVVVEELWWKALEFAALRRSSVSFFNSNKSETAVSRWARARIRAAKVGKGLLKDVKGQQLALRHWLEAIDPRHRYGHNLHSYYNVWFESGSSQPFFYWLDVGDGKEVNVDKCPRTILQSECIKYLGPKEREAHEVIMEKGKLIYKQSRAAVNTLEGTKWIFVLSTSRVLYVGQKKRGHFHHSSFLAGAATIASGRLVVLNGTLHAAWAYSGHYRPTEENFMELCNFLEENHVDLTNVKKYPIDEDIPSNAATIHKELKLPESVKTTENVSSTNTNVTEPVHAKENSIAKDHDDKEETGERRNSHRLLIDKAASYDLGKVMKQKYWSTGVGPRIGCVRDYPAQLQYKALEHVNLSPRVKPRLASLTCGPIPSPRPSPNLLMSPRLAYLGLASPRIRISASN